MLCHFHRDFLPAGAWNVDPDKDRNFSTLDPGYIYSHLAKARCSHNPHCGLSIGTVYDALNFPFT